MKKLFSPRSIAIIGVSRKKESAGQGILHSLLYGGVFDHHTNKPFRGKIYAVNPKAKKILDQPCYPDVLAIKSDVDVAIIAVPAKIVPAIMLQIAAKKIPYVIIISAGFSEVGNASIEKEVLSIARANNIQIIGPNCLGIIRPASALNASFGPCMPHDGSIAFFSQSGALIDSVIDWSLETKLGFSIIVSVGNQLDIGFEELLLFANNDPKTKAIVLYLEGLKDGKSFMQAAKKVSKNKPIVALKAGRSSTGQHAVSSHTGSLAGSYRVFEAACKQSGIHLANNVEELFEMAQALAHQPPCKNGIAIITNGGGAGVLCADHCESMGIKLPKLAKETLHQLEASGYMHPAYSKANPLDLVGDATHERYDTALQIVLGQKNIYGAIVIQTLQTMTQPMLDAKAVLKARASFPNKPIITSYMGGKFTRKATEFLESHQVPDFNVPYKAARAMQALIQRYSMK